MKSTHVWIAAALAAIALGGMANQLIERLVVTRARASRSAEEKPAATVYSMVRYVLAEGRPDPGATTVAQPLMHDCADTPATRRSLPDGWASLKATPVQDDPAAPDCGCSVSSTIPVHEYLKQSGGLQRSE